jgi:tight adherence protein B
VNPLLVNTLCGAGAGLGLLIAVYGWRGVPVDGPRRFARAVRGGQGPAGQGRAGIGTWTGRRTARLAVVVGAGVLAGVLTGWPVAVLLAAAGVWALPALLGPDRDAAARLARIEAVAGWAEQLRDTLTAAAGLEQAITVTAATAPAAIRPQVAALAGRLEAGQPLPAGLRDLAAGLADPIADLVVAALLLAAEHQARQLAALLGSLAEAAREQARMRLRVAAGRARTRTSARVVMVTTVALGCGLVVLNRGYSHGYLAPYRHPTGQLVLLAVGGLFTVGFWWLQRMACLREPNRILTGLDHGGLGRLGGLGGQGRVGS